MRKIFLAIVGSLMFVGAVYADTCRYQPVKVTGAYGQLEGNRVVLTDSSGAEDDLTYTDSSGNAYSSFSTTGTFRLIPKHADANFPAAGRWHVSFNQGQDWTPITTPDGISVTVTECYDPNPPIIQFAYGPWLCNVVVGGNLSEFSNLGFDYNNSDGLLSVRGRTYDYDGNLRETQVVVADSSGNFSIESESGSCGTFTVRALYGGSHSGSWLDSTASYPLYNHSLSSNFTTFFNHSDTH